MRPLEGVRILAVEQYGAGPFATMLLADLGAEVIKIERPGRGDVARYVPPYTGTRDSVYFQSLNRGKKSVELDLLDSGDRKVFDRLVTDADVVFNNLKGSQVENYGLDFKSLERLNPVVVCAHLSGYGRTGPRRNMPGYDYVIQGYAGWMSLTGEPDGPPQKTGLSLVDLSAGVFAALGISAALYGARVRGRGCDVDVSLIDTALSLLTYVGAWHLTNGYEPIRQPDSSHPSQVPSQILPTSDGYIVVMCAKDKFFFRLVELLGAPELATDDRFRTFELRLQNRAELVARLKELTRRRTTAEWLAVMSDEVPCGPVNTVAQALADPVHARSAMILTVEHPEFGPVRQLASPVRIDGDVAAPRRGPLLGEHTSEVLDTLRTRLVSEDGAAASDGSKETIES